MHGFSTVVNASHIGKNFHVAQQVTIGWGPSGTPTIGINVKVYAGAINVGRVHVGNNAIIGAGTVVTKDVPDNTIMFFCGDIGIGFSDIEKQIGI